jgi:glycosyl transferase family 87
MSTVERVGSGVRTSTPARIGWCASIAFFAVLPIVVLVILFVDALEARSPGIDFWQFRAAAQAILRGESPYLPASEPLTSWGGPYPYPPLPAFLAIPSTAVSHQAAGLVVMASLVVAAGATLWTLEVRDWRCYGLALLWPPVISAIQTGNLTLWFALACALTWRYRHRPAVAAVSIGITLAAKFFLWPLVVWMASTRRLLSALATVVVGAIVLLASWAVIGFAGMTDYPHLLRRLEALVGDDSYTLYIVGLDAGLPSALARLLWLAVGLALLGSVVVLGRRGDDRSGFIVALAASLALTPIVWLHYFALLLVPVALARPRLGPLWFVPLAMILTPGSGHPTPFQTAWTLGMAMVVFALALRATRLRSSDPSSDGRAVLRTRPT